MVLWEFLIGNGRELGFDEKGVGVILFLLGMSRTLERFDLIVRLKHYIGKY